MKYLDMQSAFPASYNLVKADYFRKVNKTHMKDDDYVLPELRLQL